MYVYMYVYICMRRALPALAGGLVRREPRRATQNAGAVYIHTLIAISIHIQVSISIHIYLYVRLAGNGFGPERERAIYTLYIHL